MIPNQHIKYTKSAFVPQIRRRPQRLMGRGVLKASVLHASRPVFAQMTLDAAKAS